MTFWKLPRPPRGAFVLLIILALAVGAGGCAGKQKAVTNPEPAPLEPAVVAETPAPPTASGPTADELYRGLDRYHSLYESGVDLLTAGQEMAGEARISEAANGIRLLAEDCEQVADCEVGVFLDALEGLLAEQNIVVKKQAARINELEAGIQAQAAIEREPGTSSFVASMPEIGRSVSLLRGTDLREIIELNGPVSAALDDWLTWMRPMLLDTWTNYQFLRDSMAPVYEEAGLPEALLFAMLATETGGKVHAYSRAGAAGPLQFMRRTGQIYGLRVVDGFDQRLDPEAATRANVAYLNDRFKELNDSLEKALAAYNGGEGRMRVLNRRYKGASFWDKRLYYSLPRETREYVPRVLAAAWLFLHPEDYGLEFPTVQKETESLTVRDAIAINELSVCLGQHENPEGWFRTLRNLNPELEPGERIEPGDSLLVPSLLVPVYEERCLEGELLARARKLHDANYPDGDELVPYVVRRGDTLGKIASRFSCVSMPELAELNRVRPPRYVIHVGQVLKVPACN
jgi:membrane-bound lytic murein transglycosylase D